MAGRPKIDCTEILKAVNDRGVSARQVSLLVGCSYNTAYSKLRELERRGLVVSFKDNGRLKWKRVGHSSLTEFLEESTVIVPKEVFERFKRLFKRHKNLCRFIEREHNTKMFNIVTETWNPVTGCLHNCKYCWARRLAETKLSNSKRYRNGFIPRINREEFRKKFKGGVIFVSDMGDLFGYWVPRSWIMKVINYVREFPETLFLFLTKNPGRFREFIKDFPSNVILGSTIETDRDDLYVKHNISRAPVPGERFEAMRNIDWWFKWISIEPILKFNLDRLVKWMVEINPKLIYVGYDNYNNRLPEPKLNETLKLIGELEANGFKVIRKTIRRAWYE